MVWGVLAVTLAVVTIVVSVTLAEILSGDRTLVIIDRVCARIGGVTTKYILHIADVHYDSTNRTCGCFNVTT